MPIQLPPLSDIVRLSLTLPGRHRDEFAAGTRSALLIVAKENAMPKVIADITMSLDGYVTGPGADDQHGLGDAPELHAWVTEQHAVDTEILQGATAASGAVVMGRRLFDTVDGPGGWNQDMGYGADQTGTPPFLRSHSHAAARRSARTRARDAFQLRR